MHVSQWISCARIHLRFASRGPFVLRFGWFCWNTNSYDAVDVWFEFFNTGHFVFFCVILKCPKLAIASTNHKRVGVTCVILEWILEAVSHRKCQSSQRHHGHGRSWWKGNHQGVQRLHPGITIFGQGVKFLFRNFKMLYGSFESRFDEKSNSHYHAVSAVHRWARSWISGICKLLCNKATTKLISTRKPLWCHNH